MTFLRISKLAVSLGCAAMVGCTTLQPVAVGPSSAADRSSGPALRVGDTVVVQLKGGGQHTLLLTELSKERWVGVDQASRQSLSVVPDEVGAVSRQEIDPWKTTALVVLGLLGVVLAAKAAGPAKILSTTP